MATLTIRNVNQATHDGLRMRAAANGRSVEAEVRSILDDAVDTPEHNFLIALHNAMQGEDLDFNPPIRTSTPRDIELP
ncbi:MAG: toxin-antitoxin system antitoxin subunit [Actinomycetaceae bacterium]|nr:toxin-antitoxin system antitoxin subunit [Actinomycetaceae bacterium]